ncbi:zinc metalloprotease HtpX [Patescibacteria group bacterium]
MYNQITHNKRKTVVLIVIFALVVILLGWAFGQYLGEPSLGIVLATMLATIMTLVGYFKGDKVALASSGAKEIDKKIAPEIFNLVENLSITAGIPRPKIYLIDDPAPNAFATGRKPETASIAMTTGLLKIMNKTELEGVIAHELSHIKNYDVRVMTIVVVLVGVILLLSDWMMRTFLFGKGDKREGGQLALIMLVVGVGLAVLSPIIAEMLKLAISRSREYLADASGSLLTRYPDGLANALSKIAEHDQPLKKANHATAHLFIANPFDPKVTKKFERFFSSHPPIEDRIAKLRKMT